MEDKLRDDKEADVIRDKPRMMTLELPELRSQDKKYIAFIIGSVIGNFYDVWYQEDWNWNSYIERPRDESRGDWSVKMFDIGAKLKVKPAEIASNIANSFEADNPMPTWKKIESEGGFINITYTDEYFIRVLRTILGDRFTLH